MTINSLYLSQNKWEELAQLEAKTSQNAKSELYTKLCKMVDTGRLIIPLTFDNIFKTSKIKSDKFRMHIATLQMRLSKGCVLRSQKALRQIEMVTALQKIFSQKQLHLPHNWVFAPGFMQAFSDFDEMVATDENIDKIRMLNSGNCHRESYLEFMAQIAEVRYTAHELFAIEILPFIIRNTEMNKIMNGKNILERKQIYNARLFAEFQKEISNTLSLIEQNLENLKSFGERGIYDIFNNIPILNIEFEMLTALKQDNSQDNLTSLASFCCAQPYVSFIIADKILINRAKKIGLDKKYKASISHQLSVLSDDWKLLFK